jgi:hypothetical protein
VRRLLLLLSLAGCNGIPWLDEGSCGLSGPFDPGTYHSTGGRWYNGKSQFAHARGGAKTLVLERLVDGSATVIVTYQLDGKTIVERWNSDPQRGKVPWNPPPPVRRVALSPGSTDFGVVPVGQQRDALVELRNVGAASGTPEIAMTGEGFELPGNTCLQLVTPGTGCILTVRFRPQRVGAVVGSLTARIAGSTPVVAALLATAATPNAGTADAGTDAGSD